MGDITDITNDRSFFLVADSSGANVEALDEVEDGELLRVTRTRQEGSVIQGSSRRNSDTWAGWLRRLLLTTMGTLSLVLVFSNLTHSLLAESSRLTFTEPLEGIEEHPKFFQDKSKLRVVILTASEGPFFHDSELPGHDGDRWPWCLIVYHGCKKWGRREIRGGSEKGPTLLVLRR